MDSGTIGFAKYSTKSIPKYNARKDVNFKMAAGSLKWPDLHHCST